MLSNFENFKAVKGNVFAASKNDLPYFKNWKEKIVLYLDHWIKPSIAKRQVLGNTADFQNKTKQKYEKSSLKEIQKEAIKQQLVKLMETTQPYLNSKLTIGKVAKQLHTSPYYLSQVINEKLQVNFLDFINVYRIDAAKSMLTNQKMQHYTILAIAYEAGFHSKSSFYNAFKKNTCTTPFQYRRQHLLD